MAEIRSKIEEIKKTAAEFEQLMTSKDMRLNEISGLFKILILGSYQNEALLRDIQKKLTEKFLPNDVLLLKDLSDPAHSTKGEKEKTAFDLFHIILMIDCDAPGFVAECTILIDNTCWINKSLLFVDERIAGFDAITDVTKRYCHFPHIFSYKTDEELKYKAQGWIKKETHRLAHIILRGETQIVRDISVTIH